MQRAGRPKDKTAGAVGIVARPTDYLLAVANWDSRAIDFYVSNGKLLDDPKCRFGFHARWQDSVAEKSDWQPDLRFGAYQTVNLIADANQNLFLIGFETAVSNKDLVDLFSVDMGQQPGKLLRKLANKPISLRDGNHFQYSGGIWIDRGKLAILSSERDLGRETRLNIARQAP
jgi:hypothetical protein